MARVPAASQSTLTPRRVLATGRAQLLLFAVCLLAGMGLEVVFGGVPLMLLLGAWHLLEWLLSLPGWMPAPPAIHIPLQLPGYALAALWCSWAAFLLGCVGLLNLICLRRTGSAPVVLTLPQGWLEAGHLRQGPASHAPLLLAVAVIPGIVIAKTVFT